MILQSVVGPPVSGGGFAPGIQANLRSGQLGDTIVSELHPKYYEATYRGNVFSGGTATAALSS